MTTKRQKLEAMAAQTASPEEALIAQTKLATLPVPRLEAIQQDIMSSWSKGIEEEFRIGNLLREAADILDPKARSKDASGKQAGAPFTDWFKAQDFPFSMKTAYRLRTAAEREPEVRALIAAKTGRDIGVNSAVAQLLAPPKPSRIEAALEATVPADPPFAKFRAGVYAVLGYAVGEDGVGSFTENAFLTMHIDDLAASAGFIKELAAAYNVAKQARS